MFCPKLNHIPPRSRRIIEIWKTRAFRFFRGVTLVDVNSYLRYFRRLSAEGMSNLRVSIMTPKYTAYYHAVLCMSSTVNQNARNHMPSAPSEGVSI